MDDCLKHYVDQKKSENEWNIKKLYYGKEQKRTYKIESFHTKWET